MKKAVQHNRLNKEQTSTQSYPWSNPNYLLSRRTKQKNGKIDNRENKTAL